MIQETLYQEVEDLADHIALEGDTAWKNRDADSLAALFHSEADLQFYNGLILKGRKRIRKYYAKKVFPFLPEGLRHVTKSRNVRLLTETVAIGDSDVDLVDENEEQEEKRVQRRLKVTTVVIKENGTWQIAAVRMMIPTKVKLPAAY